jgi:predicted PurR-regulated permease PerM
MNAKTFERVFLLLLVAVITAAFLWMVRTFIVTILLSALFTGFAWPLYQRFLGLTGQRQRVASSMTLASLLLLILLPALGFVGLLANEAVSVSKSVTPWVRERMTDHSISDKAMSRFPALRYALPYTKQIADKADDAADRLGDTVFKGASAFTAGTLTLLLKLLVMLYAMYFFFNDGPAIIDKIFYYMPMHRREEQRLVAGFQTMARAALRGIVMIGVIQGTLTGLAFWAAAIPGALVWGTAAALTSIVPNIGTALVWGPGCVYLFLTGKTLAATLLLLWCATVISSIDNLLRPMLVGRNTEVPDLLILISTLGGLSLFGLEGFILGPCLALVFLTIWDIYGNAFKDILQTDDP